MDQKILREDEERRIWMLINIILEPYLESLKIELTAKIKSAFLERHEEFKGTDIFESELNDFAEMQAEILIRKSEEIKEFQEHQFNKLVNMIKEKNLTGKEST